MLIEASEQIHQCWFINYCTHTLLFLSFQKIGKDTLEMKIRDIFQNPDDLFPRAFYDGHNLSPYRSRSRETFSK